MRRFLYGFTIIAGLCLLPAVAHAGPFGSPPPPEKSAAELAAEKEAEQTGLYFVGSIAAIIALLVVVQFVREVRDSAPTSAPRIRSVIHLGDGSTSDSRFDSRPDSRFESRYESKYQSRFDSRADLASTDPSDF